MKDPTSLIKRASILRTRYKNVGKIEDLDDAISLQREVLALRQPGYLKHSTFLNNLAADLSTRHHRLGKIEDLQESIVLDRDALAFCPPGHPDRSSSLGSLAVGLSTRYQQLGKMEDLEESISLKREALTLRPPGHPDRSTSLGNLAVGLSTRYQQLGKMEDLQESILLDREALSLCPPGQSGRSTFLGNLAVGLNTRYQQFGEMTDLEESILLKRQALNLRPPGHPDRSTSLSSLAVDLRTRYHRLGNIADLQESILLDRNALSLRPPGHLKRSTSLSNLAVDLSTRYQQLGKMEDLEESISLNREALTRRPPGHPTRSTSLGNVAVGLSTRYDQLGKMEDLQESISLNREALSLRPPGHPKRSISLGNLAVDLSTRYQESGGIEDLQESISVNRQALALCPPGHPGRSRSLYQLAIGLSARYEYSGKTATKDLEESIYLHREALVLRPPGHPRRSTSLGNLAISLTTRYKQLGKMEDMEESISLNREAVALRPPGHPGCSQSLDNLANTLLIRYQRFHNPMDVQEAFTYYEQAANDSTSYLKDRLMAATRWAQFSRDYQHQSALKAYTISLQLLFRALISRPDVEAQHRFLATANVPKSLGSDAASAAILAGNLPLAVEFLEQGRAMLWSKIDAYKYPLERLRQVEGGGELADRLEMLSDELERLVLLSDRTATFDKKTSTRVLSLDARIKQHRVLSEEWDCLVDRIRQKKDFTYFLKTPPFDTLRSAASDGPVVFINVSDYRSDALILTIDNPPVLVSLSTIKPGELGRQAHQLKYNEGIVTVLRYLWDNIVSPIVARLAELRVAKRSRIWWCPTAELCALPLHAAGPYRPGQRNLLDIYTSSYTSTLSSLIRARSNIQSSQVPKLLVIGQPNETLQKVGDEVQIIQEHVDVVDVLLGAEASHEAVLEGLKRHPWVHFACHGHLGDNAQPFQASFELYDDRRLTLLELIQARLPNAESAFLAACHSAAGDSRTPDENINLSAALQFCGFRSVVGTLWEMYDEDAPMMSREFYKYMFRNPKRIDFRDSAYALGSAIREMRKAKLPPQRWVMFVHIGA